MRSNGSLTVEHWGCRRPFLFLEIGGMSERDGVFWRAFDAEGRELGLESPPGDSFRYGTQTRDERKKATALYMESATRHG